MLIAICGTGSTGLVPDQDTTNDTGHNSALNSIGLLRNQDSQGAVELYAVAYTETDPESELVYRGVHIGSTALGCGFGHGVILR